jgi:hypothetical protein
MTTAADLTAGTVLSAMAVLMNDPSKTKYTNAKMIPFLNIALQELREVFEQNNVPVTDTVTSEPINIPAGYDHIAFNNGSNPSLPIDFVEPKIVWERPEGIDPYIMMTRLNTLPRQYEGVEVNQFIWYIWQSQEIRFLPSNQDNDIKMDYVRQIFSPVVDENSTINVVNAATFLEYRGGGLCAEFIGENPTRAASLNNDAILALDRVVGIGTKGRQAIITRRLPFRNGYKQRVM